MTRRPLPVLALLGLLAACAPTTPPAPGPEAHGVDLVTRDAWGAAPAVGPMRPHEIDRITVHHTAWNQQPERPLDDKLQALQRFSQSEEEVAPGRMKEAWADIPYHYYIDVHGRVAEARSVRYAGDTNTDYDPAGHLLIVLEGNFEEDEPTAEQLASLERMLRWGASRWDIPADRVDGHDDHASTLCPGRNLKRHLPALRQALGGNSGAR